LSQKISGNSKLKQHIASVHEKKKPIKCELYNYSCAIAGTLNKHIAAIIERKNPFKCDLCDSSFLDKGCLNYHVASVHEKRQTSSVNFVIAIFLTSETELHTPKLFMKDRLLSNAKSVTLTFIEKEK